MCRAIRNAPASRCGQTRLVFFDVGPSDGERRAAWRDLLRRVAPPSDRRWTVRQAALQGWFCDVANAESVPGSRGWGAGRTWMQDCVPHGSHLWSALDATLGRRIGCSRRFVRSGRSKRARDLLRHLPGARVLRKGRCRFFARVACSLLRDGAGAWPFDARRAVPG